MKKYFLTTALIGAFAAPAFAANNTITGGAGTCTVEVLGVHENDAIANTIATWDLIDYECPAGQYLLNSDGTLECTECPVGSYCPGGKFTVESENNGTNACPTDYTSDAGAVGENECYMGCELACSTNVECPPHSNNCTHSEFKTTGKQFSGETCNAYPSVCPIADFSCNTGYSKIAATSSDLMDFQQLFTQQLKESDVSGYLSCNILNEDETDGKHNNISDNGINDCDFLEPGQMAYIIGEGSLALVYQVVLNNYNEDTVSGIKTSTYWVGCGSEVPECESRTNRYLENANFQSGITGDNIWHTLKYIAIPDMSKYELLYSAAEEFSSGSVSSETMMVLQNNLSAGALGLLQNVMKNADNLDSDQLENIFNVILFDTMNKVETNLPWLYGGIVENESVLNNLGLVIPIALLIEALNWDDMFPDWIGSFCYPHTINIDWNPDNGGAHIQNMCYYDGAVSLPTPDPVKPGYTFMGWKLLEENK